MKRTVIRKKKIGKGYIKYIRIKHPSGEGFVEFINPSTRQIEILDDYLISKK